MEKESIIVLANIEPSGELHQKFSDALKFPSFDGMNWDAFWDTITGLIEMPKKVILKNHNE